MVDYKGIFANTRECKDALQCVFTFARYRFKFINFMSKVCQLTGKRPQVGHNISHSNRKTLRRFNPNLTTKKMVDPLSGKTYRIKLSVSAQRTLLKNPGKFTVQLKKLAAKRA